MKFTPHPYQEYCIQYLLERPAAGLFLDMGLGKTVITLTAIDALIYDRFEVSKVLVIAPLRVAEDTWTRECDKWDHLKHLRVSRVLGTAAQRAKALERDADIYCINRDNVQWLVKRCRDDWPFDMVVIDELSSFKNPSAKRFKMLRMVRPLIKRLWGLTGTPSPNGLIDLWAQMYLLDRGERLEKTVTKYRAKYFRPGNGQGYVVYEWLPRPGSEEAIYTAIGDICISMKATDYIQLPERVDVERIVTLDAGARELYEEMEKETILTFADGVVDAGNAAVVSGKLLQIANGAVYDEDGAVHEIHSAKLDALEDIIEEANGRPVLVIYAYKHDEARIMRRFPQAVKLAGEDEIARWNRGEIPVLLMHSSAGYGLNLQDGGDILVWFGLTWNLEEYQQTNARIYRQGSTSKRVTIIHLVAEDTNDERAMKVLAGKATKQEALLDAVRAGIKKYKGGVR